jgi:short-subunit dehydrogenase
VNVVIGAASGMGAAVASLLAPRGRLLLADRTADPLTGLAAGLFGDEFVTKQEPTACGMATLDEKNDDLVVVTESR